MIRCNLGFVDVINEHPNRLENIIPDPDSLDWLLLNKRSIILYETRDIATLVSKDFITTTRYSLFFGGVVSQAWLDLTLEELRLLVKELEGAWA